MKVKPTASIGLPVYNGEKYLEQALNSILAQSYTDFELLISDNASTDRTQEICQTYLAEDPRIIYHRNEKNLGAAPNHNLVFKLASGKYFKWMGYDDIVAPNFMARCVEILDSNTDVVLCFPKSLIIDDQGNVVDEFDYTFRTDLQEPHKRFGNFVFHLKTGNLFYGLMRADTIRKTSLHGSYPSSDLVFLAELALHGQFYVIPEPLFYRRKHLEQSTKGTLKVERDRVLWFDTSNEGKILLPKWQYLFGYLRAIRNGPVNRSQQAYCYLQMVRWVLYPQHFKAMGKDVLLAGQKILVRSLIKHEPKTQKIAGKTSE